MGGPIAACECGSRHRLPSGGVSERQRLIALVQRILDGDCSSDEEVDSLVAAFQGGVPDPAAMDLTFWPSNRFDHEPTAAEIVDRALSHRPIEL